MFINKLFVYFKKMLPFFAVLFVFFSAEKAFAGAHDKECTPELMSKKTPCIHWNEWRTLTDEYTGFCYPPKISKRYCKAVIWARFGDMKNYSYIRKDTPLRARTAIEFGTQVWEVNYWGTAIANTELRWLMNLKSTPSVASQKSQFEVCEFKKGVGDFIKGTAKFVGIAAEIGIPILITGLAISTGGGLAIGALVVVRGTMIANSLLATTATSSAIQLTDGVKHYIEELNAPRELVVKDNAVMQALFKAFDDDEVLESFIEDDKTDNNNTHSFVKLEPLIPQLWKDEGMVSAMYHLFPAHAAATQLCNDSNYDPDEKVEEMKPYVK